MKTTMKTNHALCGLLSGLLLLAAGITQTHGSIILGPSVAIFANHIDGATPTIFDRTVTGSFSAGTYDVTNFDVRIDAFGGGKGATPFLATGTPTTYTTIWVGPTFTPTSTGVQNISYTLGTQQFTLPSGQTVFAGFDSVGGPLVDVAGSGGVADYVATDISVTTSGQTINTEGQGAPFRYSFDIGVAAAPEPTSAVLLLSSGAMLLLRRRRAAAL